VIVSKRPSQGSPRRSRGLVPAVGALALILALPACGTRLSNAHFQALAGGGNGVSAGGGVGQGGGGLGNESGPNAALNGLTGNGAAGTQGGGIAGNGPGGNGPGGNGVGPSGQGVTGPGLRTRANFASDVGVTANSITLGNVTGADGPLGPDAFGTTLRGLQIWVSATNARGGIGGRKIIPKYCNDNQDGSQNLACTEKLVDSDHIFVFAANNSLSSGAAAKWESTHNPPIPDVGFPLNNGYSKYPNMFSFYGNGYPRDGKQVGVNGNLYGSTGLFRWFKLHRGVTKGASIFYAQSASQQAGQGEANGMEAEGIKVVYEPAGGQGDNFAAPNFDNDAISMKQAGAQLITDAIDVNAAQKLCTAIDRYDYHPVARLSTIENWNQDVGSPAWSRPCRDTMYIGGVSQPYSDSGVPAVARYLADYKAYGTGVLQAQWTLEGYYDGQMVADAILAMGADVTRQGFINWFDGIPTRGYTDHGVLLPEDWRPSPHGGNTLVEDCSVIVQWQDSAATFVTRDNGSTSCYMTHELSNPSSPDGS